MSVWFAIPSKRPPEEVEPILQLWHERGYKIALWRDWDDCKQWPLGYAQFARTGPAYPGYAAVMNDLVEQILQRHTDAQWIVTGGDDTHPDQNHTAEEIGEQCRQRFRLAAVARSLKHVAPDYSNRELDSLATFGVMQPTGDRWGDNAYSRQRWPDAPAIIDRIAGSPWLGREFCRRMYGGTGPYWPEYTHNFVDEELQNVALKLGVFWQRRDLSHFHDSPARYGKARPPWLEHNYTTEAFDAAKVIFERRKAAGFPGHEPIA